MKPFTAQDLFDSLEFEEVIKVDKDGNLIIKKVY